MDENHYNFIKRPPKSLVKRQQDSRAILNKIENFERPTVRPNTVDADRMIRLKKMKQMQAMSAEESIEHIQLLREPQNSHTVSRIKRVKSKKIQPRRSSLQPRGGEKTERVETTQTQRLKPKAEEVEAQPIVARTHFDSEMKALDNLRNLSLNENNNDEADHYLSGWTNSYPLKQAVKKCARPPLPVNRSTSSYSQQPRYRLVRVQPNSQLDRSNPQDHQQNECPKMEAECLPLDFRRAISHCPPSQPQQRPQFRDDIQSSFLANSNEQKIIFFRNGIINQLRRKQQMGRHTVLEQWRYHMNSSLQGQCLH